MNHPQKKITSVLMLCIGCMTLVHLYAKKRISKALQNPTPLAAAVTPNKEHKETDTSAETKTTPTALSASAPIKQTTSATLVSAQKQTPQTTDFVTVTNCIKRTEIPHTSKWGTYTPKEFDIALTIRLASDESVTLPRSLLENGDVDIQCSFTFKQGLYSRSETYTEQLKIAQDTSDHLDLAFQWEKPRFSLHAHTAPQKNTAQTAAQT